jgi:hypothetical protein
MPKRKKKPAIPPPPSTPADRTLVNEALHWIDLLQSPLSADQSSSFYTRYVMKLVRDGTWSVLRVTQMADDRNWGHLADAAIRELAAESIGQQWHPLVQAYLLIHPTPLRRGRGRNEVDNLLRDTVVGIWVGIGRERWPFLSLTRNDATETPSVCWVIARACYERGIHVSEDRVEDIYGLNADIFGQHREWLLAHDPGFLSPERIIQRHQTLRKLT